MCSGFNQSPAFLLLSDNKGGHGLLVPSLVWLVLIYKVKISV